MIVSMVWAKLVLAGDAGRSPQEPECTSSGSTYYKILVQYGEELQYCPLPTP